MKKSKREKKSNTWKIKQHRDQFFKRSKTQGYRSRASFKLIELNKKFKFIKKDTYLLISNGKILAIDKKLMEPIKNVKFLNCDIFDIKTKENILNFFEEKVDVIISDMAADTTGSKSLDSIRTNQLCAEVLNLSSKILKPKGVLVSKLFMGEDFIEVKNFAKTIFKDVNFFKPEASRNESKETYLHCKTLKTL